MNYHVYLHVCTHVLCGLARELERAMDTGSSSSDETPGSASASADSVTQTGIDERENEASSSDQRPCVKKARYACIYISPTVE